MDWITGTSIFLNLSIEKDMAHPWDLAALLHTPPSRLPKEIKHNVILRDTIVAWQAIRKELKLPIKISPHLPMMGNPNFHREDFIRHVKTGKTKD